MRVDLDSSKVAAVDREYYWRPIQSCPLGVKVQLISSLNGVAVYGSYNGKHRSPWTHWAPLPVFKKDENGKDADPGV